MGTLGYVGSNRGGPSTIDGKPKIISARILFFRFVIVHGISLAAFNAVRVGRRCSIHRDS